MQLRCFKCHRPFALNKEAVLAAYEFVTSNDLSHYDVVCPHCKRVNPVSRQELQRAQAQYRMGEKETEATAKGVAEKTEDAA